MSRRPPFLSFLETLFPLKRGASASRSNVTVDPHVLGPERGRAGKLKGTTLFERFGPTLPHLFGTDDGFVVLESLRPGEYEGIGFVLGIRPQTGTTDAIVRGLEGLVTSLLPHGATVAVTLYADPDVDAAVSVYERSRLKHLSHLAPDVQAALSTMATERGKLLRRAAREQIRPHSPVYCRRFRGWVSVVLAERKPLDPTFLEKARATRAQLKVCLEESLLLDADWTHEDLLNTLSAILNPQKVRRGSFMRKTLSPSTEMRLQVMAPDTEIRVEKNGILFADADDEDLAFAVRAVGLSVTSMPHEWSLNHMSAMIGDPGRSGSQIPCPFLYTTWWQSTDPVLEKTRVESELMRARQMSRTPVSTFISHYHEREATLSMASQGFARGFPVVPAQTELLLLAPALESELAVEAARTLARKQGIELRPNASLHIQSLQASLPLVAGPHLARDSRAYDRLPRRTGEVVTSLLPVVADYQGTGRRDHEKEETPLLALLSRRGHLFFVDPFACRAGSFSGTVVGKPGSGKSVVLNELALAVLAQGGRVWIIDRGRSYEKLCRLLGGNFIEFGDASEVQWDGNPLRYLTNEADMVERVTAALEELFGEGERDSLIHQWLLANLPRIRFDAAAKGRMPLLSDLIDELRKTVKADGTPDQRFHDAAAKLAPYAPGGPLAHWTDGSGKPFDFSSSFTVLEMQGLDGHPTLRNSLLLQIMLAIEAEMVKDRRPPKLVLIDEAWELMKSGRSASFIEKGFRQARKLNGAFFTATQSIADFWKSETATAAWMCSDTRIFLRQDVETLESLAKKGEFVPDPWLKAAIGSLTTVRGLWSEMVVQVGDAPPAIGRLVLDDFTRVTESSHAQEVVGVEDWRALGVPLAEAIRRIAANRYPPRNP